MTPGERDRIAFETSTYPTRNAVNNEPVRESNPKTLMGRTKIPMLSVIPPTALIYLGMAMKYGAYEAPKKDGTHGYGPYNWREQPIEAMVYVDAALRHILAYVDGSWLDPDSNKPHLAHAMATLAILVDAIENNKALDDRPCERSGVAEKLMRSETVTTEDTKR